MVDGSHTWHAWKSTPKILAFAGSARRDSFNKKLVRIAADSAREAGAEVTLIELEDYSLPLFNQDEEAASGLPPNGRKLKDLFLSHHGLLIASPEYNSSITGSSRTRSTGFRDPSRAKPRWRATPTRLRCS